MSDWRENACSVVYERLLDGVRVRLFARLSLLVERYCFECLGGVAGEEEGRRIVDHTPPTIREICGRLHHVVVHTSKTGHTASIPQGVWLPQITGAPSMRLYTKDVQNKELRRELENTLNELDELQLHSSQLWTALTRLTKHVSSLQQLIVACPRLAPYLLDQNDSGTAEIQGLVTEVERAHDSLQDFTQKVLCAGDEQREAAAHVSVPVGAHDGVPRHNVCQTCLDRGRRHRAQ